MNIMTAAFEPLILYVVLFLSGSMARFPAAAPAFSVKTELARILLYNIPSLALIWHLLLKNGALPEPGTRPPGRKDLPSLLLALPVLVLTGFTIAVISAGSPAIPKPPVVLRPASVPAWIVLVISCLSTGYLEESFFRYYALSKQEGMGLGPCTAVLVSTLLFSLCHLYEGPWGFLNAALSGTALSVIFLRCRSLHGVALAHGLYNIFVYAAGAAGP